MAPSEKALKKLLLEDAEGRDLTRLAEYEQVGGYESLKKALKMEPQAVLDELLAADVRGRGGAGFPDGSQGELPAQAGPDDEADLPRRRTPTSRSPARSRTARSSPALPHMFIEGCVIASRVIGANTAFIYIRGEYLTEFEILRDALEEARRAGLVGANVLGSGWNLTVVVHRGAGAYICGEETGLLESLEGKRGQPRSKPPFPAISGVYASPTLINNVETLATVPKILEIGGENYAKLGVENSTRHAPLLALRATWSTAATTSSSSARACAS